MRSTRARVFVVIGAVLSALIAVGCTTGDDAVVATELDLSRVVVDQTALSGAPQPVDDLSLRTPGQGGEEQAAPGEVTGRATPPTLSANPVITAPTTSSTVAPTTTAVPTTPLSTASTASTTVSTTAPTSSTDSPQSGDSTPAPDDSTTTTVTGDEPTTTVPVADGADLAPGEGQSFTLLNSLRASLGLTPLARNAEMDAFAREWSRQMAESGRFEHSTGPYGENIAFTSNTGLSAGEAAELFHQLWIDSPGHYANMTNGQYASTGVGLYLTDRGWYGTHVFSF